MEKKLKLISIRDATGVDCRVLVFLLPEKNGCKTSSHCVTMCGVKFIEQAAAFATQRLSESISPQYINLLKMHENVGPTVAFSLGISDNPPTMRSIS